MAIKVYKIKCNSIYTLKCKKKRPLLIRGLHSKVFQKSKIPLFMSLTTEYKKVMYFQKMGKQSIRTGE